MKLKHLCALLATCAATASSFAGVAISSGRLVEWIQVSENERRVSVGLGRGVNPVVIYERDFAQSWAPSYVQFLLFRQDYAAFFISETLRKGRQFSNPSGSFEFPNGASIRHLPYSEIEETLAYSHPALQGQGARGLSCLAYGRLNQSERRTFRDLVIKRGAPDRDPPLIIYPTTEPLTTVDIAFIESSQSQRLQATSPGER